MKSQTLAIFCLVMLMVLLSTQLVIATDLNADISSEDKETFDEMLEPIVKIYNLVKYTATTLAVVILLFSGVTYMTAGSNPAKREQAKSMATYVIVGLVVIWAAPLIVNFIVG